jgi:hypothetical protein
MAVSLFQLTLLVRLCDYADCRKPLNSVLHCAKCKGVAYCSKDCQVCSPQRTHCELRSPLAQETGKRTSAQHESMHALDAKAHAHFSLLPQISPTFLWRLRCACTCLQKNIHRDCPFLAAPSPFFIQKPTHLSLLHCFYPLPTTGCQTKPWKARHKRHVPCLHCYYSLA